MPAPAALESLRVQTARKLKSYSICRIGCRWVVVRFSPLYGEHDEKTCTNLLDAIEHLHRKLPPITNPPDIVRQDT